MLRAIDTIAPRLSRMSNKLDISFPQAACQRGLCAACHSAAAYLVHAGSTTWPALVAAGVLFPPTRTRRRPVRGPIGPARRWILERLGVPPLAI